MIDCSKTENYFIEKKRMLKATESTVCRVGCAKCPLSAGNNNKGICCTDFEVLYSEKAIAIVQKWSNAHPQKTYLSELLEHYPNASLHDDGTPHLYPSDLGWNDSRKCREQSNCVECWSQIIPIEEDEE